MMEKTLSIGGIVSLSTVDYPDHIATVVFLQGCPWRCKYCHNQHLRSILPSESFPWEDVLNLLKSRIGFVEAVVFSGGDPLIQPALLDAIMSVKNLGFLAGLHTAGVSPDTLAKVVQYVDWVGFDIKHNSKDYPLITQVEGSGEVAYKSLQIAIASNVDLEVRITMDKIIDSSSIVDILKDLSEMGVKKIALQKCRDKDEIVVEHPIFSDRMLLEDMSKYFDSFLIR
jgi:anaerobic ribonucleoside-triphosphate reductase activating protein